MDIAKDFEVLEDNTVNFVGDMDVVDTTRSDKSARIDRPCQAFLN